MKESFNSIFKMNITEVAQRLVSLSKTGAWEQAQNELFHPDAVSIEPDNLPNPSVKGLENIKKKAETWASMVEATHGGEVSEPLIADDFFSVRMSYDVTFKDRGRVQESEICVYHVKDGKIVSEQFFYSVPSA